jgi:hypothetical protein
VRTPALVDGGKYGKMLQPITAEVLKPMMERQHPISAERFAEEALQAVAKNRAIIVIPARWKLVWWLHRLSPGLGSYLGRKGFEIATRTLGSPPPNRTPQPTEAASPGPARQEGSSGDAGG